MANKADTDASAKRARTAAKNLRTEFDSYKKKARDKIAKARAEKVPNALINTGIAATTGIASGALQGIIPDDIVIMKRQVPLGLIRDSAGVLVGTAIAGGSAFMGQEIGIHAGGGIATVSAAGIARKLTSWGREQAMGWWSENGKKPGETEEQYQERLRAAA